MKKLSIIILFVLLSLPILAQTDSINIVNEGDKMPSFVLSSIANGNINSKDLNGKVVMITIFATWCGPCQLELKEINNELWPKYKDNSNFKLLVVGREHTAEELAKYKETKSFAFPIYPDPVREFTSKFAKQTIPRVYLVDKSGTIVYTSVGYNKPAFDKMMEKIDILLGE